MSEPLRPGSLSSRLGDNPTVLVVEDEADIAEFLGAYFRASGLALDHLDPTTVDEVADTVARIRPSCVLLDLHLRGLSGLDAYRRLRADPDNALLPVIMVTADTRATVKRNALEGGVDAFVTKPFNVKALFALVQDRVARAGMRAEVSPVPASGDTITGLGTHGYVQDRLTDEIAVAAHTARPVAFGLLKLRSLRETNQRMGHAAGDFLLREVARRLRHAFDEPAVVGRNAGDEFAVVLPGSHLDDAAAWVERAIDEAGQAVALPGDGTADVVLAAGVAVHPEHGADRDELYVAADVALTEACERDERLHVAR